MYLSSLEGSEIDSSENLTIFKSLAYLLAQMELLQRSYRDISADLQKLPRNLKYARLMTIDYFWHPTKTNKRVKSIFLKFIYFTRTLKLSITLSSACALALLLKNSLVLTFKKFLDDFSDIFKF